MRKIISFCLIITFVCLSTAKAQPNFSLTDCINYGLKNNRTQLIMDNNIAIAKQKANQTLSGYLPQISTSFSLVDNIQLPITTIPAGTFGPTQTTPKEVQFGSQYNTNASLDFGQVIYDQSKIYGIMTNKPLVALTELQKEQNKENTIYNISVAYFQALIAKELQKSLLNNKEKYTELLKTLHTQQKLGVALQKDIDRVTVAQNSTNYQIEDAVTKEQLALNSLKYTIGMPLNESLSVNDSMDYLQFAGLHTTDKLVVSNLVETKLNEKQIEMQKLNLKAKRASWIPTVSLVGKYGNQALNNDFKNVFSNWNNYSYIGISISKPLLSLKIQSVGKEEKLKLQNDKENYKLNQENLKLRYENAKTSSFSAYSSFKSAKDNMNFAKNLLDVTFFQYQKGVVSLTDYLNDDTAYKNAQSNYVGSLYNVMISELNFNKAQGTLLEFVNQIK